MTIAILDNRSRQASAPRWPNRLLAARIASAAMVTMQNIDIAAIEAAGLKPRACRPLRP
jgi:hypothetical protein